MTDSARREAAATRPQGARAWTVRVFGAVLALIGPALTLGGGWLVLLGGSLYYLPAGLGLLVAGALLMRLERSGVWVYLAVWAAALH